MDEAAPITWLIGQIHSLVGAAVQAVSGELIAAIMPIVATGVTIYLFLVTLSYLRGNNPEPIVDMVKRLMALSLVLGLGLNANNYTNMILPMVTGIGGDLATKISGGDATANAMDQLALHYFKILEEGYEAADTQPFPFNVGPLLLYLLKAVIVLVGLVPLLVACALAYLVADVGAQLVASVGPLFFAFLLFPATRQWFSSWLNSVLSLALIPILIATLAGISLQLSRQAFGGATLHDVSLKAVFLAMLINLALMYLIVQINNFASGLSAGGVTMGQVGGVGSLAASARNSVNTSVRELLGALRVGSAIGSGAQKMKDRFANRNNTMKKVG